jgi:hypothetical protein
MDFGGRTDPFPFILAAYSLTAFLLIAYSLWQIQLRKKLRMLEAALKEGGQS